MFSQLVRAAWGSSWWGLEKDTKLATLELKRNGKPSVPLGRQKRSYKQHIFTQKKVADVPGTAQRASGVPVVIAE